MLEWARKDNPIMAMNPNAVVRHDISDADIEKNAKV